MLLQIIRSNVGRTSETAEMVSGATLLLRRVNSMHDSFSPLSGGILLANMMVDEVIVGALLLRPLYTTFMEFLYRRFRAPLEFLCKQ